MAWIRASILLTSFCTVAEIARHGFGLLHGIAHSGCARLRFQRLGIAQAAVAGVVHDADDAHAPLRCLRIRRVEVEITPEGVLLAEVVAR